MNINFLFFSQCFISSILELSALSLIIYALKQSISNKTIAIVGKIFIFSSLSAVVSYLDNNTFLFRLLCLIIVFMYVRIFSNSTIIHSLYLTIISYICLIIIQLMIVATLQFTLLNQDIFLIQIIGNGLTIIIAFLVNRFIPIHYVYEYILRKDIPFRFFLGNTFVIIVLINYLTNAHLSHFIYYFVTIGIVVALLIFVNVEFLRSRVIVDRQQNIIDTHNQYLPIVDELIQQVRNRQHSYDNNLQSISALAMTCDNYESLRSELLKNIDTMAKSDLPMFLLKFNLKLLSGLLFQKYCSAQKQNINMRFTINNYNIQSSTPEYIIVEATGILLDNAIEASNENDTINITIDCTQNKYHFYISNKGPILTSEFYKNIFTHGYTTKSSSGHNNGIGLNNLLNIIKKYNGNIEIGNNEDFEENHLFFCIDL